MSMWRQIPQRLGVDLPPLGTHTQTRLLTHTHTYTEIHTLLHSYIHGKHTTNEQLV